MLLFVGQTLAMPLTVLINAVMARHLGAGEFGFFYLASTLTTFGLLFVDWGQSSTIAAFVARDRARSGEFLGSGLAWRLGAAPCVFGLILLGVWAFGYPWELCVAFAILALSVTLTSAASACQDTVRGFERTDIAAWSLVGQQLLTVAIIVPVLQLGGRLPAVLFAITAVSALMLLFVARALRGVGVGPPLVRRDTVRRLLVEGWPFLFFGLSMALQPSVDALFLSALAPAGVVGWHAAARKLVGVLVYPASALVAALYPTLCRLHAEDKDGFIETTRSALRTASVLVAPLAIGTYLYADLGIRIFGADAFGPAVANLRVYALFIALVYFSMPLGSSLLAAGRQKAWAVAQLLCVLVSLVLDPLLVPWFQARTGNGGLGICVATLASELLMVAAGLWLTPRGILNRALTRTLGLTAVAGAAMVAAALLLARTGLTPFVGAPLAATAYFAALWAVGGVASEQMDVIRGMISRKAGRASR
jgi:O-antigen/teichoic acid export membrane protein